MSTSKQTNNLADAITICGACTSSKDMWKRVKRLMRGTIQNKVDRETRFINKFDQFAAEPGEALFATRMVKILTQVRLAKQLTVDSFDNLFDYLQQFEKLVNASRAKNLEKSHDPLALVAHTSSSSRQNIILLCNLEIPLNVKDSEDTLEEAFKSLQKMNEWDIKEMKDVFESTESELDELEKQNDLLKDQLLEASLKHDVELCVLLNHECVDKILSDEHDQVKKKSFKIPEGLESRIKILEKDVQRCQKQSVDF
ncbi:hypothetical protein Tco_0129117 [Tanacetum coccineum]